MTAAGRNFALVALPLFLFALLIRVVGIGDAPLHPDEIHYIHDFVAPQETASLGALRDMHCDMLIERRSAHPPLAMLLTRMLWYLPLRDHVLQGPGFFRGFNALVGALLVPLGWAIGWLLGGPRRAAMLAALIALQPGLHWISRTAYLDSIFTLGFSTLVLGAVALATRGGVWAPILAGVGAAMIFTTKISAPLVLPAFLLLPLLAPRGQRIRSAMLLFPAAAVLTLALVDPAAYLQAITQPSDPRYRSEWDNNGPAGYMQLVFVELATYIPVLLWDATLPLLGAALVATRGTLQRRSLPEAWVVLLLLSLAPLGAMHNPRLSGAHGYAPAWFLVAVLASAICGAKGLRYLLPAFVLCVAFSLWCRAEARWPFAPIDPLIPYPDPRFAALRDDIPRAGDDRRQILVLENSPTIGGSWSDIMRGGFLAEGAIWLRPCRDTTADADSLQWADLVVLSIRFPTPPITKVALEASFEQYAQAGLYSFWRRSTGTTRRSATAGELVPFGANTLAIPGRVYPWATTLAIDDYRLDRPWNPPLPWHFDGMTNFQTIGTGAITPPPAPDPATLITLAPPEPEDIFWDF
jgi:hypothetical protein